MRINMQPISTLLIVCFVHIFVSSGYSQQMGSVYWFKKGVNEQNLDKKVEYYTKAIEGKPNFIEAHYNLGLVYINQKKYEQAELSFKNALIANPSALKNSLKRTILKRMGSLYRNMRRFEESEESFQAALNITSQSKVRAIILYELGQTKIAQQQFDEAIKYFERGINESPQDRLTFETGIQIAENKKQTRALYKQGVEALKNQDLSLAAERFTQVIDINPNHTEARNQLEQINQTIEQSRLLGDKETQILMDQARTYLKNGDLKLAIKYFEDVKEKKPDHSEVDKLLADAKERQRTELLIEQKLNNLYFRGIENYKQGNYTIALTNFEQVHSLNPNYKDIDARLSRLRRDINRFKSQTSESFDESFVNYQSDDVISSTQASRQLSRQESETDQFFDQRSRKMNAAIDSQLVQNFYQEALELMQKRDWLQATIVMEKIRMIDPNYKNTRFLLDQAKGHLNMGENYVVQKESSSSKAKMSTMMILAFLAGILILPTVGILFLSPVTRARYYLLQKRYDKAREIYENLISKKPNNVKLYITLANIYINENRIDSIAVSVFEKAIQYNDDLKFRLEPIVNKYYLEKSKQTQNPKNLLNGSLKDELDKMGKS